MLSNLNHFNSLRIVHGALTAGLILFGAIAFFLVKQEMFNPASDMELDRKLQVIVVLIAAAAGIFGFRLFKKRLLSVHQSQVSAELKMNDYRKACFVWWAMLEGPALFSLVCFIVTGNYAFFFLAVFMILVLALFMPRRDNIILLLQLKEDEVRRLEGDA